MDNYREEVVIRKKGRVIYNIAYIMVWVFIVLFGLMGVMYLSSMLGMDFSIQVILGFVLYGGMALLLFYVKDNLRTEYEYCFTNGMIDFDKVLGNRRRKHLLSLRMSEVEDGGFTDSDAIDKYLDMHDVKKLNYYLNGNERVFFLYFIREGKKQLVFFEPSDAFIALMKQYSKVMHV